ncbi:MAG: ArsR family transcriptional regulator, zinc-responsive transcriptional repressor [Actinomycetota bacterium]|nr:ArsR family transcriptional regulator, zinc-responsive transcriptional repressor [Actinomycetota bacterium]MEA2486662.1 ArsR family transcriptional regulator, zinc-responsive transcriptional repressor [Actinomycetota bacterium]
MSNDKGLHEPTRSEPVDVVDVSSYESASELLKTLTAPIRLALVEVLSSGPRCVHELVDVLEIAQPLVSQHLKVLKNARLVSTSRRGREVVYTLTDDHVHRLIEDLLAHSREA